MLFITINEAKEILMTACPGLYANLVSELYDRNIIEKSSAYVLYGAIVIKTLWCNTENYIWYICDTGKSDMDSVLNELKATNIDKQDIIMIYARKLEGIHCLIFSNFGKPYDDPDIRPLLENDSEQIISLTIVKEDDDVYTKSISQNIYNDFLRQKNNISIKLLGFFKNNELMGAVSVENINDKEVIIIRDLFVAQKNRNRGYASRLVKAALNLYPSIRYSYSCGTDNHASIAAAKAAGFKLEGTYHFL